MSTSTGTRTTLGSHLRRLAPVTGLVLFAGALFVLHHELGALHLSEVVASLGGIPTASLVLAVTITALGYLALASYDRLALRYLGNKLPATQSGLAGFLGFAFSQNIGLSVLSGAPVRFRLYSAWGLSAVEVTTILAFNSVSFWLGLVAAGGIAFTFTSTGILPGLHLPFATLRPIGIILLSLLALYLTACARFRRTLHIGQWQAQLPNLGLAMGQVAIALTDWILAAAALWVLLPRTADGSLAIAFPRFLAVYVVAQLLGLISQVPGGLGVFETIVLVVLPSSVPHHTAIGALIAYRVIYYLLPLVVAILLLLGYELAQRRHMFVRAASVLGSWLPALAPDLLAINTFLAGVMLLVFGALPSIPGRLHWLNELIPLALLELSHFLGSVLGVVLLLLAWGLHRRLGAAYYLTTTVLGTSILLALLRGLQLEVAAALAVMLAVLVPARRLFYRRTSLLSEPLSRDWLAAVLMVFLGALWIGFFAYRHVDYSADLWWQFTLRGDAPRFLRAAVGMGLALASLGMARLLGPATPREGPPTSDELERIRSLVASSPRASAHLALLGDKRFIVSDSGAAFLMYGNARHSWVAAGDPVGPESEHAELLWRFHTLADRHGGWTVLYEVGGDDLGLYLDLGLAVLKIGEEAVVTLPDFALGGHKRKGLRYTVNKLEREGCRFEVLAPGEVAGLLRTGELREVSDEWLRSKRTREKRFSLGSFDEEYLARCPLAIVRCGEEITAFANLWLGAPGHEISIDLMRYRTTAPKGVMDYLFTKLMLWGQKQGYGEFNLGMAPLAGLQSGPLASLWNRFANVVYHAGEPFYNFQGLRLYKEKFDPTWRPRYLVCPGGTALVGVLADLAVLISGGILGVLHK